MNLERFRQRCINRITETYNNLENIDRLFGSEERNILVEIQNDDTINNKDEAFNFARQRLNEEKGIMISRIIEALRRDIRICAKELSRLASDREIYEYYKLVSTAPSCEEYNRHLNMSLSEFESNVFREYIMSEPRIENIIISYSELEAYNLENNDVEEIEEEIEETEEEIEETEEEIEETEEEIEETEEEIEETEEEIEETEEEIEETEEEIEETEEEIEETEEEIEENDNDEFMRACLAVIGALRANQDVPANIVSTIEARYLELLNSEITEEQNNVYRRMVQEYNIYVHRLNQNEFVESRRGRFSVIDGITEIFGKGVSLIRSTRAYKTRCLRKIAEATNENDQETRRKYISLLTDQDIVCNLTRMRRENTIESLNYRLLRDNCLSGRRMNRLHRTAERYANSLERQLDRKIQRENEIFESGARTITVLNQYLEVLSNINCYETKVVEFEELLNELREREFISEELFNIYYREAQNIVNYRDAMNGSIYILDLEDIVDLTNHYQDSENITKDIPFIKRRHN